MGIWYSYSFLYNISKELCTKKDEAQSQTLGTYDMVHYFKGKNSEPSLKTVQTHDLICY